MLTESWAVRLDMGKRKSARFPQSPRLMGATV